MQMPLTWDLSVASAYFGNKTEGIKGGRSPGKALVLPGLNTVDVGLAGLKALWR